MEESGAAGIFHGNFSSARAWHPRQPVETPERVMAALANASCFFALLLTCFALAVGAFLAVDGSFCAEAITMAGRSRDLRHVFQTTWSRMEYNAAVACRRAERSAPGGGLADSWAPRRLSSSSATTRAGPLPRPEAQPFPSKWRRSLHAPRPADSASAAAATPSKSEESSMTAIKVLIVGMIGVSAFKVAPYVAEHGVGHALQLMEANSAYFARAGVSRLGLVLRLEGTRQSVVERGGVAKLVRVLESWDAQDRELGAGALRALATLSRVEGALEALLAAGGERVLRNVQRERASTSQGAELPGDLELEDLLKDLGRGVFRPVS